MIYGILSFENVGSKQIMLQRFRDCADSVSRRMSSNRLKLNPSKTELIWFYSGRRQLSFVDNDSFLAIALLQFTLLET